MINLREPKVGDRIRIPHNDKVECPTCPHCGFQPQNENGEVIEGIIFRVRSRDGSTYCIKCSKMLPPAEGYYYDFKVDKPDFIKGQLLVCRISDLEIIDQVIIGYDPGSASGDYSV